MRSGGKVSPERGEAQVAASAGAPPGSAQPALPTSWTLLYRAVGIALAALAIGLMIGGPRLEPWARDFASRAERGLGLDVAGPRSSSPPKK